MCMRKFRKDTYLEKVPIANMQHMFLYILDGVAACRKFVTIYCYWSLPLLPSLIPIPSACHTTFTLFLMPLVLLTTKTTTRAAVSSAMCNSFAIYTYSAYLQTYIDKHLQL